MKSHFKRFLAGVMIAVAFTANAQDTSARLSGVVVDSVGSVIPSAPFRLVNVETNSETTSGTTNERGEFSALQLPPGEYVLTISAPGFQTTSTRVKLSVASRVDLPITLQVGAVTDTVVVNSQVEQLRRSDVTVSTLIDPQDVASLPMPNREITNLVALAPGAAHGGPATNVNTSQLSINGSRTANNEFLLDGNSVVEGVTGQVSRLPSPDMLSEFRIITSNAPAEYGRTSGAVITMVTRSGKDGFHGGVYELFRNTVLNANRFTNKLQTPIAPRGAFKYNQFGAFFSGPIRIPGLYDGRRRSFFYLNYDQTIRRDPYTQTQTVPSAALRNGDFSTSPTDIYDPLTKQPFPGKIIPQGRIDPAARKILALVPLPNTAGTFDAVNNRYTGNYFFQDSQPTLAPRYSGRLDHSIGDKLRLYASVNRWNNFGAVQPTFNNSLLSNVASCNCSQGWQVSTGGTETVNSSAVVDIRTAWNRWVGITVAPSDGTDPASAFGIQRNPYPQPPAINISGWPQLGPSPGATSRTYSNTYSTFGSVTKVIRTHTIKAGALLRKNQVNVFNPGTPFNGIYNFSGEITNRSTSSGIATNALADFLLGAVKTSSYDLPQPLLGRRNYNAGVYVQDDYRISPKLTANIGVRYEYESPMYIATDLYSRFDMATGELLIANKNASRTLNIDSAKLNVAPRIGLSYSPNASMVVHAGFGTYYGQILSNFGGQVSFPGYDVPVTYNNLGAGVAQSFTLAQGMPLTGVQDFDHPEKALATASPTNPFSFFSSSYQKVSPMSMIQQWTAGIQQQIGFSTAVEINYVGSHGLHLPLFFTGNLPDINQATAIAYAGTTIASQLARPFTKLNALNGIYNVGQSNYNSLQVGARRFMKNNLAFMTSYTWSHNIDDGSGVFNFSQPNGLVQGQYPINPDLRRLDRSSGAFDARHLFTLTAQYKTKGPWWMRNIEISPIFSARTGFPITVTQTNFFPGATTQRPNGDTSKLTITPYRNGSTIQYLKPVPPSASANSFPLTPSGPIFTGTGAARHQIVATALGNVPRYSVRAPGEINLDVAVQRSFPIYDNVRLIFRVDAFNVMNHNSLVQPASAMSVGFDNTQAFFTSPTFGQTNSSVSNRFLQVVTRINF